MDILRYIILVVLTICTLDSFCQSQNSKSNSAADEVLKSLKKNESYVDIAESYEKLAKGLSEKGEYAKSEDYYKKARELYVKHKNKEKIAVVDREIAKVQEAQNKFSDAIINYRSASNIGVNKEQRLSNSNDANRLSNTNNLKAQQEYVQQNLELFEETGNAEDKAVALKQMAKIKIELNDKDGAITDLESAMKVVKERPEEVIKINRDIAKIYADNEQLDKAININKKLVEEAQKINNPEVEIAQLKSLSSNYFNANKSEEGLLVLKQAYELAIKEGNTIEAKNSLILLVDQYKKEKQSQRALDAYGDFIEKLDQLVKQDSTIIYDKLFLVQEERISQLENERELKDEIISKTTTFNIVLLVSIVMVLIFLVFIARALYSIKKKNKKIALQSLRREMNPHFIFNSLNSVNQYIAQNNELEANKYLSSYSKLMRNIMENSNKDFIPLSVEIEHMKEYLELEYMRFNDKFRYYIDVDSLLDTDSVLVPNMLIQPQLENAIWHGLRYKNEQGLLTLTIKSDRNIINIIIEDNGVGLRKSQELKTKHQKEHKSRGLNNTYERIKLLNSLYGTNISIDIVEKEIEETGTIVTLKFQLINKN